MNQSINFLNALPKKTSLISAFLIGVVALAVFGVLVVFSLITSYKQHMAHQTIKTTQYSLEIEKKAYDKIAEDYPLLASETPLVNKVKELIDKYQAKKAEAESLKHSTIRLGFSQYMLGLAQNTPGTLWLNKIQINQDSASITLTGYSMSPDAVSELMSRLATNLAFSQVVFKLFFLKTIKNHPYVKFSIATTDLGPEEENELEQKEKIPDKPKE